MTLKRTFVSVLGIFALSCLADSVHVKLPRTDIGGKTPSDLRLWNDDLSVTVSPAAGGRLVRFQNRMTGVDALSAPNITNSVLVGFPAVWSSGKIDWMPACRAGAPLPVDWTYTRQRDGSKTIWFGGIDAAFKWTIGLSLAPNRAACEVDCRFMNRTDVEQLSSFPTNRVNTSAWGAGPSADTPSFVWIAAGDPPASGPVPPAATRRLRWQCYSVTGLPHVVNATVKGCVGLERRGADKVFLGFNTSVSLKNAKIELVAGTNVVTETANLAPNAPWFKEFTFVDLPEGTIPLSARLIDAGGQLVVGSLPAGQTKEARSDAADQKRERESRAVAALTRARAACRAGDFAAARLEAERSLAAVESSAGYVVKAYALRRLGNGPAASKALRFACKSDPLDYRSAIERAFLENDGSDAVVSAEKGRAFKMPLLLDSLEEYARLGANDEIHELIRQARARGYVAPDFDRFLTARPVKK